MNGNNDNGNQGDGHGGGGGGPGNGNGNNTVTIVVDGSPHEVNKGTATYADVVTLAYAVAQGEGWRRSQGQALARAPAVVVQVIAAATCRSWKLAA